MNKPDLDYKPIKDYLSQENVIFVIPKYQRPYSWGRDNCERLWQDVRDFKKNEESQYFFGTVIVNEELDHKENEKSKYYQLIDGQQRTITFFLLLKALLESTDEILIDMQNNCPNDESLKESVKEWRLMREDIMMCLYKIEQQTIPDRPSLADAKIYESGSGRILINKTGDAKKDDFERIIKYHPFRYQDDHKSIENIVLKQKGRHGDNKYSNYYRNYKYFKEFIAEQRKLSTETLRSLVRSILKDCLIIQIKTTNAEDQAIAMFNSLNSKGMPLCDSDIIHATLYANAEQKDEFEIQWNMIKTKASNLEYFDVFRAEAGLDSLLYQYMYCLRAQNGEMKDATPGLRRFFMNLEGNTKMQTPFEMCTDLLQLANCWEKIKDNILLKVLLKFNENFRLFLACYLFRFDKPERIPTDGLKLILESLLRLFVLLAVGEAGYSSKQFKTFLFSEASKLCNPDVEEEKIAEEFNDHIRKEWKNQDDVQAQIKDCERNSLVYLNEYLTGKSFNLDLKRCNIEHIMPQSGRKPIMEQIRSNAKLSNPEEFEAHVNKLGNKILLEDSINVSISNEWFKLKVTKGYCKSSYPLAKQLSDDYKKLVQNNGKPHPHWTREDICKATEEACTRISKFIYPTDPA